MTSTSAGAGLRRLPLGDVHRRAGAVLEESGGAEVPRHHGDPAAEYRAATEGVALVDRSHRLRLRVVGRAPSQMLQGILTNAVPPPPAPRGEGVLAGTAAYSAVLTPKGKMVTDLRVLHAGAPEVDELLLDVPAAGAAGLAAHLVKFLPPRLARAEEVPDAVLFTLLGPGAAGLAARTVAAGRASAEELEGLEEGEYLRISRGPSGSWALLACGDVATPALDVLVDGAGPGDAARLWDALVSAGAVPAGHEVWETLRIEAGRPAYGPDMDEGTLPVEAGIERRAIDHGKGCYTGQEVIVRIRDRGKVNWHLRGLFLGEAPQPVPGATLHRAGEEKAVGRITSAALSPRAGGRIALGYVRREVEPPAELRLGSPAGLPVAVKRIGERGWDV